MDLYDFLMRNEPSLKEYYIDNPKKFDEIKDNLTDYDWNYISRYENLSEEFIRKFKNKVNWRNVLAKQKLSKDFIREFHYKIKDDLTENDWILISQKKLNEKFIRKFKDKVYWNYILHNKYQKYYSIEFIQDFAPKMNYYYKFHTYSRRIQRWWKDIYYRPQGKGFKKCENEFKEYLKN